MLVSVCVCARVYKHVQAFCAQKSEDNWWKSALSSHYVGSRFSDLMAKHLFFLAEPSHQHSLMFVLTFPGELIMLRVLSRLLVVWRKVWLSL